jgi:putative MATE family efflux protein
MLLEAPIFRFAAVGANVLNLLALIGMITFDALFVGRLGPDALAGLTLAFPWVMLMQHAAASGVGGAVSSAVARALGAGKRDSADALASHALALTIVMAVLFSALMLLGAPVLFGWMGGRGAVLDAALAYSNVAFGGAVSICALNLLGSVVRGTGNMGLPAAVIVGAVLAHVGLSPLLIFGWGPVPALGAAGAGWGLVVSFGAGSLVLLFYLRSSRSLVKLAFRGVALRWAPFADFLKVGVPGLVNVAITNLSVVALTGIAGRLGRETAIGYGMGARLEYILIPIAFGFGTAIVAMVGTSWGAKQYARARRTAWTGAATVALCQARSACSSRSSAALDGSFHGERGNLRIGTSYLSRRPIYAFYGLGMSLYFATQAGTRGPDGDGERRPAAHERGRELASGFWLGLGTAGFFRVDRGRIHRIWRVQRVRADARKSAGTLHQRVPEGPTGCKLPPEISAVIARMKSASRLPASSGYRRASVSSPAIRSTRKLRKSSRRSHQAPSVQLLPQK